MRILLTLEYWAETLRERYPAQTILTLVLLAALAAAGLTHARRFHLRNACEQRMLHIYQALQAYTAEHGAYPELAFYPDNPLADANSILVTLAPYGLSPTDLLCPGTAPALRQTGNTLLWNVRLGGIPPDQQMNPQWIVTEINAMSPNVPPPHGKHYNILYTDGSVRSQRIPPAIP
jgi:prepilin-type processing-associated H-X9-DG protein